MASTKVAKIDAKAEVLTLINVYEVEPEKQQELVKLLSALTEQTIRHQPGFVSVSIHGSFDGKRVLNYAQWASKSDFDAFVKSAAAQEQLKQFASLAKSVSPALYKVNATHIA